MEGEAGEAARDSCLGAAAESTLQPFPTSLETGAPGEGPDCPSLGHQPSPGQAAWTLLLPAEYQGGEGGELQNATWTPAF